MRVQRCRVPGRDDRLKHTHVLILKHDSVVMRRCNRSVESVQMLTPLPSSRLTKQSRCCVEMLPVRSSDGDTDRHLRAVIVLLTLRAVEVGEGVGEGG
jgi:hypothetical protein